MVLIIALTRLVHRQQVMHCLEVYTQSSAHARTVNLFLASLPHSLRELWIECTTSQVDDLERMVSNGRPCDRNCANGRTDGRVSVQTGRSHPYTDLVVGNRGDRPFVERGWSTYLEPSLRNSMHGLRR